MSDVNEVVVEWRQDLLENKGIASDDVAELESHLLQEMEMLQKSGLKPDEAFVIASRRLGHPADLATEYAKSYALLSWRRPARLLLWGLLLIELMQVGWALLSAGIIYFRPWHLVDLGWWNLRFGPFRVPEWCALLVFWWLAENAQGRVATCLHRLEQSLRSLAGAVGLLIGVTLCGIAKVALNLTGLWLYRTQVQGFPDGHGEIDFFASNMIFMSIYSELTWTLPVVAVLIALIRTEGRWPQIKLGWPRSRSAKTAAE